MTIEGMTGAEYDFLQAMTIVTSFGPKYGEPGYDKFHKALDTMLGQANRWGQEMVKREAENNGD